MFLFSPQELLFLLKNIHIVLDIWGLQVKSVENQW